MWMSTNLVSKVLRDITQNLGLNLVYTNYHLTLYASLYTHKKNMSA